MERITYQRTLDVHKNGIQFTLQGVETGDNLSRVVEISLMASGDAIDFPLENVLPVMYVKTPKATEPSIIECEIKDNTVIYEVLPIVEEGITEMQLKLIETSPEGATRVLVAPRFAIEATKSAADDSSAIQKTEFTALETAVARAKGVYDKRFIRMELTSDCSFRAYYADGTIYENDILKQLFFKGDAILAQSYARGGTGARANEDTDNAMYYSNVSKSASLEAKDVVENSEELLEEVRLHGVYTAFKVDFEKGEVEYVSPAYNFKINVETGDLETDGVTYSFEEQIGTLAEKWLEANNINIGQLQAISGTHTQAISNLEVNQTFIREQVEFLDATCDMLHNNNNRVDTEINNLKEAKTLHQNKLNELYNTTSSHAGLLSGQANEISDIKDDIAWKTLGSVSNYKSVSTSNKTTNETLTIPFDESILRKYSDVRMVIKKGSKFIVWAADTSGTQAYSRLSAKYKGTDIIYAQVTGRSTGSSGPGVRYEIVLGEDKVFYPLRGFDTINRVKVADNAVTISDINGLADINIISITALGSNGSTTAEWVIEAELQGRE